uniref:6-phosphofructo-2-kinase domain-containing protein n=1 Tax=Arcella intermedia TaxID=1963864 RepID=A0A6B2LFU4_9EUKA
MKAILDQVFDWLDQGGEVAIFDATNTTKESRAQILGLCNAKEPRVSLIFIENICDDPKVLAENFKKKIHHSKEYKGVPYEDAAKDLKRRILKYDNIYRPLEDDEPLCFVKIVNLQSKVVFNRVGPSIPQMLPSFLMSLHNARRPIYFTRPADSEVVRDECNTPRTVITRTGEQYARNLASTIEQRLPEHLRPKLTIYTGTSSQSIQTAKFLEKANHIQMTCLNKMQTGDCRGMSTRQLH